MNALKISISFLLLLLVPLRPLAQTDPQIQWKTMSSEHFSIIFDAKQLEIATIYLEQAEIAYKRLQPIFQSAPEKTYIVLKDNTDLSNGLATTFPYPYMQLYPVLPELTSMIGYYEDWSQLLTTHELTHILNLEPTNGNAKILRRIFGSVIKPNILLPRWYTEGLAVEMESYFSSTGRLRSPIYDASIRAKVKEEKWGNENLAQINESMSPGWPSGSRPYFYGALVWHKMHKDYGSDFIRDLNNTTSKTLPYPPDNSLFLLKNSDFSQELTQTYSYFKEKASEQIQIMSQQASPYSTVTTDEIDISRPRFQDKNTISYIRTNSHGENELVLASIDIEKKQLSQKKILFRKDNIISYVFSAGKVYYLKNSTYKRFYDFNDIWEYDLKKQRHQQITFGERINSFSLNKVEHKIIYSRYKLGKYELKSLSLNNNDSELLYSSEIYDYITDPHKRDTEFYFVLKKSGSLPQLVKFNSKGNKLTTLEARDVAQFNSTENGDLLIVRSNGTQNAFLRTSQNRLQQLTNSLSAVKDCDLFAENIICSQITSQGWQLQAHKMQTVSAKSMKNLSDFIPAPKFSNANIKTEYEVKDYSTLTNLLPQYWIPFIYSENEKLGFSINIGGHDPLAINSYSANFNYDNLNEDFSYGFSFINQSLYTPISLYADKTLTYIYATDETITDNRLQLGISSYIYGLSNNWNWNIYGRYYETIGNNFSPTRRLGLGSSVVYNSLSTDIWYKITPEKGQLFSLAHIEYFKKNDYTDYSSTELLYLTYWHPNFFPKHHSFKLYFSGVYAPSNGRSLGTGVISSISENSIFSTAKPSVRGYLAENFLAYSSAIGSLQYDLPLKYWFNGFHSLPLFFHKASLGFFVDTGIYDGAYYFEGTGPLITTDLDQNFTGYGIELATKVTAFYHIPLWLRLSVAYGDDVEAGGGWQYYFSLGL